MILCPLYVIGRLCLPCLSTVSLACHRTVQKPVVQERAVFDLVRMALVIYQF